MRPFNFKDPEDEQRFKVGAEWHSLDGGKTWIPGPCPAIVKFKDREPQLRVLSVDYENGIIKVGS